MGKVLLDMTMSLDGFIAGNKIKEGDVSVISKSAPILNGPVVVRKDMADGDKAAIRAAFLAVKDPVALKNAIERLLDQKAYGPAQIRQGIVDRLSVTRSIRTQPQSCIGLLYVKPRQGHFHFGARQMVSRAFAHYDV